MIMMQGYWSWNIFYDLFKCLRFLKGCLNAILQFPISQENLEKNNTHTWLFFFEKSWENFS